MNEATRKDRQRRLIMWAGLYFMGLSLPRVLGYDTAFLPQTCLLIAGWAGANAARYLIGQHD